MNNKKNLSELIKNLHKEIIELKEQPQIQQIEYDLWIKGEGGEIVSSQYFYNGTVIDKTLPRIG